MTKTVDFLQQLKDIGKIYITENLKKLRGDEYSDNDLKCFGGMVEDNNKGGWVSYFYNKTNPSTRFMRINKILVFDKKGGKSIGVEVYSQYLLQTPIQTIKQYHKLLPYD